MENLAPVNRIPENTAGLRYFEVEEYRVQSWGPLPDGQPPQTEVHFSLHLSGLPTPLVLRIKSADAADTLIAALQRHRNDVWPVIPAKG